MCRYVVSALQRKLCQIVHNRPEGGPRGGIRCSALPHFKRSQAGCRGRPALRLVRGTAETHCGALSELSSPAEDQGSGASPWLCRATLGTTQLSAPSLRLPGQNQWVVRALFQSYRPKRDRGQQWKRWPHSLRPAWNSIRIPFYGF